MACGARQDEHDGPSGPCRKTQCKGFSDSFTTFDLDSYTAFNENWTDGGIGKKKAPEPEIPTIPHTLRETWQDWIVAHPFYAAAAILMLFVITAVVLWLTR